MMNALSRFASKHGLYYGWYVAGACALIGVITNGVGLFSHGVFLAYFTQEYGWSRSGLSLGPMLFHLWAGVAGIFVGRYIDRRGPRTVQIIGAFVCATGVLALGLSRHLWQTYPAFLLLSTGFAGIHNVTLGKIIANWFRRNRARAMALATFGVSFGAIIIIPLTAAVLQAWGGFAGGLILAVTTLGVVVPLALWVIKDGPEVLGLYVDGDFASAEDDASLPAGENEYQWTLAEAVQTLAFWALAISFPLVVMTQAGFVVHQVLIYQSSFGLLGAAGLAAMASLMGILSRLGFLLFTIRWPWQHLASCVYIFEALGLLLLAFAKIKWLIIGSAALLGFCMSLTLILEPIITSECFGKTAYGRIYGPIYFGTRVAAALGALLYGVMASATGSYRLALCVMAAALCLATCSIQLAIPPVKRGANL